MSTIITRNSATSGSVPSSLVQGELAINVTDSRLFYGSGSGNVVKEFGVTSSYSLNTLSASYAQTASYAPAYLPLTGGTINGNVTVNGTASIAFLNVVYESASVIYSSGSNQFGDASNDVQTLWGTVDIKSGPVLVTGSLNISNGITGSLLGTASYAINALSASYAPDTTFPYTGSAIISGSLTLTGSYNQLGDYTHTGSVYHSGSKYLNGIFIQTGSLTITGSTTQIGNNTLLGNTILSGSIIISGSTTTPTTPTIKVYGDMETNGVIKFDPVVKSIDNSISASYIYVSGSTNDLYFSQNGSGYSNTTRLRWLEGNLYTGLLHGGLITTQSSTVYQISSGSGVIVNLNASVGSDPYPTIQLLQWGNLSASIAPFTASFQQAFVGIDSTNNIFAQGTPFSNGQFSDIINIGNVLFQNQSTINGVKTQPSVAYGFEQQQNTFNRAFGPLKLSGYTLAPSGSSTGSLIVGSGTAYAPGSNYTIDPNDPSYTIDPGTNVSKIFRYHQSGSTWVYNTNGGPGFATIDPTKYSNNGVLTTVGGGNWTIQRCFYFPNSVTKAIVVYYGNARYGTEAEARANIDFESFVEAPNTSANAIYLGAIIINGTGVFTSPGDFTIYPGGLFRQVGGSGGGGSIVTQTLAGLSDVSISGPTDGQALVYNHTAAKWENSSTLTANLIGNASTATTASYALTASYTPSISGTDNYIPRFNGSNALENSVMYDDGTNIGIGTTSPVYKLSVVGKIALNDGGDSVFIGTNAGLSDDATSNQNVAIGTNASQNNVTGTNNVSVGYLALNTNLGSTNTAIGSWALQNNTTGASNTAVGSASQINSGIGSFNTSVGTNSLFFNASGSTNAAFGSSTLRNLTSGSSNTAIGTSALFTATAGFDNTAIGGAALYSNTTGSENSALGRNAGRYYGGTGTSANTNASGSIFIGFNSRANGIGQTNQIVIGNEALGLGSNTVVLGNDAVTTTALKGNVGIGKTNPSTKLDVNGNTTVTGSLLVTGSVYINNALYSNQTTTLATENKVVYSVPTATYNAIFVDYVAVNGSNVRAGQIVSATDGTSTTYTETTTTDIGSTTPVTFNVSLSGGNFQLEASASTSTWTVKTTTRVL